MFLGVAGVTSRHNVLQRVRSSLAQGCDVILRQMSLRTFPTVSAAMVIRRLHCHPLGRRKIADRGPTFQSRVAFAGGLSLLRVSSIVVTGLLAFLLWILRTT